MTAHKGEGGEWPDDQSVVRLSREVLANHYERRDLDAVVRAMVSDLMWVEPLDSMHAQTVQGMRCIIEPEYGTRAYSRRGLEHPHGGRSARRSGALRLHGGRHRRRGDRVPPGGHVRVGSDGGRPAGGAPAPVEFMRRAAASRLPSSRARTASPTSSTRVRRPLRRAAVTVSRPPRIASSASPPTAAVPLCAPTKDASARANA